MTLYIDGKPYFLDYREVAPKAASKTLYLNEKGEVIENLSTVGSRASRRAGHRCWGCGKPTSASASCRGPNC